MFTQLRGRRIFVPKRWTLTESARCERVPLNVRRERPAPVCGVSVPLNMRCERHAQRKKTRTLRPAFLLVDEDEVLFNVVRD